MTIQDLIENSRYDNFLNFFCEITLSTLSAIGYLETLQSKFPKGKGLKYLLLDSCYDDSDTHEKESFDTNMGRLWDLLDQAPSLPTAKFASEKERELLRKFAIFKENRKNTISKLLEIADYIDKTARATGIAKVKQFK